MSSSRRSSAGTSTWDRLAGLGERKLAELVVLEITDHCPRCVMTTLPQGDLPKDSGILRTAARHNEVHVGVYGEVRRGGRVQRGDTVTLG